MRDIKMSYYNVYYYCNIIDNILHCFTSSIEWAPTSAQFLEMYYEVETSDFPKYSALHSFCDYAIRQLIWEEDRSLLEDISAKYDDGIAETLDYEARLKYAFSDVDTLWIDRILNNFSKNTQSFYEFLREKFSNGKCTYLEDEYNDFIFLNGEYDNAVFKLTRELFYVLFQNREFLLRFNYYMADEKYVHQRCYIPEWVKRAVKYRDRGKCACCCKDLSGVLDCEDENSVHYDHIVPLSNGGLNDVSNIQLLCRDCNLNKLSSVKTNTIYKDWYDFDED